MYTFDVLNSNRKKKCIIFIMICDFFLTKQHYDQFVAIVNFSGFQVREYFYMFVLLMATVTLLVFFFAI